MVHGGRTQRVSRRWAWGVVAVLLGTTLGAAGAGAPASASNGDAIFNIYRTPASIEYGEDVEINGSAEDASNSCTSVPFDCDEPEGQAFIQGPDGTYLAAADLNPDEGGLSFWGPMTYDGDTLPPGQYALTIGLRSTFDPEDRLWNLTVRKIACSVTLTQTQPTSNLNDSVTFQATVTTNLLGPGYPMTFYDQNGDVFATPTVDSAGQASFTTAALPQGTTTIYALYAPGNPAYFDQCGNAVDHTVATDPNPYTFDDTYHVDAGATITVHPLKNDWDLGPGPLRVEYLDSPDLGDSSNSDDGRTLTYTAPEDVVAEDAMHYVAYDGAGQGSNEGTVRFLIGCQPVAEDDAYDVAYGAPTTVAGPGVYGNDERCDLPTSVQVEPEHGEVDLDGDSGGFVYTPDARYSGYDTFTYRYSEGLDTPVDATVTVFVAPPITPTSTTTTSTSTTSTSTSTTTTSTSTTTTSTSTTTTTDPSTPTASEQAVTAWYEALLDRSPDAGGLDYWAGRLDGGASRVGITRQLLGSTEGRRRVVRRLYEWTLNRAPDSGGLDYWAGLLAQGRTPDDLRVGLLASAEAWAAGGDAAGWADLVYGSLLGRPAGSGDEAWVASTLAAGTGRSRIVRWITASTEARRHHAALWYDAILGRPPTPTEADQWAAARAEGTRELTLVAELASTLAPPG